MKKNILIIPLLLISFSCGFSQKKNKELNKNGLIKDTMFHEKIAGTNLNHAVSESNNINLSEFRRYQTFDEFKMKGVGKPIHEPFVYTKTEKEKITVIVSNDTTNVMTYNLRDGLWFIHMDFDLWKKNQYRANLNFNFICND